MTDTLLVQDDGFKAEDWTHAIYALDALPANDTNDPFGVDLASSDEPAELADRLSSLAFIRVDFPSFADGRGFTIGRQLRDLGFTGRLRARGHVIADQYAMARRSGFDEVEISTDLALRQPEDQWRARANWRAHDYQSRLRG